MTTELPELRIIDAETWEAAQGRRAGASCVHLTHRRRPKRLLSGLLRCGMCGGNYIVRTRNYVACSRRMNTGTCDNNREVAMPEIEERVLAALRRHLLSPEMVEIAVESYRAERERLAREQAKTRAESDRELSETKKRIAHIVAAIETGADPASLLARLDELESRRRMIEAQMQLFDTRKVVSLHPQAATRYREMERGQKAEMDRRRQQAPHHRSWLPVLVSHLGRGGCNISARRHRTGDGPPSWQSG